MIDEMNKMYLL